MSLTIERLKAEHEQEKEPKDGGRRQYAKCS